MRTSILLNKKSPTPGHGWGCFQCGLAIDGATAVLCDPCLEKFAAGQAKLIWACKGWPGKDGRVKFEDLQGEHQHDLSQHPETEYYPAGKGFTA